MQIEIVGKVIDVGRLAEGDGFTLEVDGETVSVVGMTQEETKKVGRCYGQLVKITIADEQDKL